jgi:plastocyanin
MNRNKMVAVVVAVVVVLAAVVFVVMSDNKKTTTPSNAPTANSQTSTTSSNSVTIEDFNFQPAKITVHKGTTVTWTNHDSMAHTVTADAGSSDMFDSGSLAKDQTFTHTFDTVGMVNYHCTFHSNMKAMVEVTE